MKGEKQTCLTNEQPAFKKLYLPLSVIDQYSYMYAVQCHQNQDLKSLYGSTFFFF